MNNQNIAHNLEDKLRTKDVILEENVNFDSLLLSSNILQGLTASGYKKPSPIQLKSIPLGRCGFDLIMKSKSGTGKTLVFSILSLESVDIKKNEIQTLILVPAREIATQIEEVLKNIGSFIEGLQIESFIGGLPLEDDIRKLKNCHIAVGTPGRIKQLINKELLKTTSINLFVLDEADKLMEPSFQNEINEIFLKLPSRKQLITSSATYTSELEEFLTNYMLSPTYINAENETPLLLGLRQFISVTVASNPNISQQLKAKNERLIQILSTVSFTQCLIFSNYQTRAESLCNYLKQNDWDSTFISAAQTQVKRLQAVDDLKKFRCRILVSTDLIARGIDCSNIDLVINYDTPRDAVTYLHRMGRAGRFGSVGVCITLVLDTIELKSIENIIGVIGGESLSVAKLPEDLTNLNLWNLDLQELPQIYGSVATNSEDIQISLKQEMIKLKEDSNRKNEEEVSEATRQEDEKKSRKKSKKAKKTRDNSQNASIAVEKMEEELMENSEDSLEAQSIFAALAAGSNIIETVCEPLSKRIKESEEFGETAEEKLIKQQKNHEVYQQINHITQESQETQEQTFEDTSKQTPHEMKNQSLEEIEKQAIQETKNQNLQQIESQTTQQITKKSYLEFERPKNLDPKTLTFCKNQALLNVTKLISDPFSETPNDTINSIDTYMSCVETGDELLASKFLETNPSENVQEILDNSQGFNTMNSEEVEVLETKINSEESLENIFHTAYDYAIKPNQKHWLSQFSDNEVADFERYCQVKSADSEEDEDMEDYENEEEEDYEYQEESYEYQNGEFEYQDEEYGYQNENYEYQGYGDERHTNQNQHHDDQNKYLEGNRSQRKENRSHRKQNMHDEREQDQEGTGECSANLEMRNQFEEDTTMKWVPVENSTETQNCPSEEVFRNCYDDCSNSLWQNGLSFENVEDFDRWFYQWQTHVMSVRNYVQQNIYVSEMSKYQKRKRFSE